MLALRKTTAERGVTLLAIEPPVPSEGEVLVSVEAAGICGTDLHIADWTGGYESMAASLPVTLGHEFAGQVVQGPQEFVGKRVVIRPSVTCQACMDCAAAPEERCGHRRGIGIHRNGGFAAFAVAPVRNCIVVPDDLDAELAALTEPMSVSSHAVAQAGIHRNATVLVLGPGPIGLGAAIFAAARGANVHVRGRDDPHRLSIARVLGFAAGPDPGNGSYDAVIEATGSPEAVSVALEWLKPGGTLVVAGIHPRPAAIDLTALVRSERRIVGSYRAPVAVWSEVLGTLTASPERFRALITHRLSLSTALDGFAAMRRREACKVMLIP